VRDSPASFEAEPPSAAELEARILQATASYAWLVMEDEGEVVGFAYASEHGARAAYRWSANVAVYVRATHHRSGVGRRLYEALLNLLRRQGLQVACAGITLPNESSVGLHEALGFECIGVFPGIGWKHGAWRDVGWYTLRLIPASDGTPPEPLGPQRLDG
jgi:phosphinothricin acetyltransferase